MFTNDEKNPIREFGESGVSLVFLRDIGTNKDVVCISKLNNRTLHIFEIRGSRYIEITSKLENGHDEKLFYNCNISDFYYIREITDKEKSIIRSEENAVYLILDRSDY